MSKKKSPVMILIFSVFMMLFFETEIYAKKFVDITNRFETGIVDIGIKEYQNTNGTEELWKDYPMVLPGDTVSKIPRIYNYGTDCYVRVKLTFRGSGEITENNLFGINDQWMRADDGCYYYKEILKKGKTVDVFEGLKIQEDLLKSMAGTSFYIDIDADAIQSKNFTPDFESSSPWGSVEIIRCGKEGQYDIEILKKSDTQSFVIEYQGRSGNLIKNKDDFFINFPYLMPGDKYSDFLRIINNDKVQNMKIYFRSEAKDDSELPDKILLRITTEINDKKKEIYYGPLRAVELSQDNLLGVIGSGTEGIFYFEIEVPKELNNKYTILDSHVKWIFSTEPLPAKPVQTGDMAAIGIYSTELCVSGGAVAVIFKKKMRRKGKREDEKNTDQ